MTVPHLVEDDIVRRVVMGLALVAVAAVGGCRGKGTSLVPVSGKVTLDDRPLALKSLQFIPEEGTPGQGAGASTDPDGNYVLLAVRPGATRDFPGVPPGKYRVVVTEPMFPIDTPLPTASGDGGPAPAIGIPGTEKKRKTQPIPAVYTSKETTPLQVEVPHEGGVIPLSLTSKP